MSGVGAQGHAVVGGDWPRDVLCVRGPDAVSFLQGQVSADVEGLEPGRSTLALLLDPSGKMEALVRLWRTDEQIVVIDTDGGGGDAAQARLERFMLRTDAVVERLDWRCSILRGPGAPEVDVADSGAELVGLGLWPGIEGVDLLGPRQPTLAVEPAGEGQLEALRIRAGWPALGAEITPEVIPAEIGPWLITAAVSFTKGCYVGQELTARIDSRGGNVPRSLRTFETDATVAVGDSIVDLADPGTAVGSVTSAAVDPAGSSTPVMGFVKRGVDPDATLAASAEL